MSLTAHRATTELDGPLFLDIPGLAKLPVALKWRHKAEIGVAFDAPTHRQSMLKMQLQRLMGPPGR